MEAFSRYVNFSNGANLSTVALRAKYMNKNIFFHVQKTPKDKTFSFYLETQKVFKFKIFMLYLLKMTRKSCYFLNSW